MGEPEELRTEILKATAAWNICDGDHTLKITYPLLKGSVVFDVGGYQGDWTAAIHERYGCPIHLFEPVSEYAELCVKRFKDIPTIHVHNVGLWVDDRRLPICVDGDRSSLFAKGISVEVQMVDIVRFMASHEIPRVNLMSLNCEGAEYGILKYLMASGVVELFDFIQIQFHDIVSDAVSRRNTIRNHLMRTHQPSWCYPFVWESWRKR